MSEKKEPPEHKKWLDRLEKEFNDNGFTTIREGKMFLPGRHWKEPDLFVLHAESQLRLLLVLEVNAEPAYRDVLKKVKRIKHRYNPSQIIIFEPVEFMNKEYGARLKSHSAYNNADSFRQVEDRKEEEWRKEEYIEVSFWNEKDYQDKIRELASEFTA